MLNEKLLEMALYGMQKQAFVPPMGAPGMDPAAGGAPPMDPAAAGGAPPMDPAMMGGGGGAPPMDPAMTGGAPPMDPAAMGAPPDLSGDPMIQQIIQQTIAATMEQMNGGAQQKPKGAAKIDPAVMMTELSRITKLLTNLHAKADIPLPADILDPPTEAPAQGEPAGPKIAAYTEVEEQGIESEVPAQSTKPAAATGSNDSLLDLCKRAFG